MASTIKVDTITTPDGTGNIAFSRPIVADVSNVTGTLPAIDGSNLTGLSAGAWSVKSSGTATNVATLEFTGITKTTRVLLTNFSPAVSPTNVGVRTSSNGGTSYDVGGSDYRYLFQYDEWSVTSYQEQKGLNDGIYAMSSLGNGATDTNIFDLTIFEPQNAARYTVSRIDNCQYNVSNGQMSQMQGYCWREQAAVVNALQWLLTVGTTFSCTYLVLELN